MTITLVVIWWIIGTYILRRMYQRAKDTYGYPLIPIVFIGGSHIILISLVIWGMLGEFGIQ